MLATRHALVCLLLASASSVRAQSVPSADQQARFQTWFSSFLATYGQRPGLDGVKVSWFEQRFGYLSTAEVQSLQHEVAIHPDHPGKWMLDSVAQKPDRMEYTLFSVGDRFRVEMRLIGVRSGKPVDWPRSTADNGNETWMWGSDGQQKGVMLTPTRGQPSDPGYAHYRALDFAKQDLDWLLCADLAKRGPILSEITAKLISSDEFQATWTGRPDSKEEGASLILRGSWNGTSGELKRSVNKWQGEPSFTEYLNWHDEPALGRSIPHRVVRTSNNKTPIANMMREIVEISAFPKEYIAALTTRPENGKPDELRGTWVVQTIEDRRTPSSPNAGTAAATPASAANSDMTVIPPASTAFATKSTWFLAIASGVLAIGIVIQRIRNR